MTQKKMAKKRLVTSLHNLTSELQQAVKEAYPQGFTDSMIRIEKPNGDFFYAVTFATEEIDYLVKIDVKVDGKNHDDDKDIFVDEMSGGGDDELHGDDDEEDEPRKRRSSSTDEYDDDDI